MFEGMILFSPSDLSLSSPPSVDPSPLSPPSPPTAPPPASSDASNSQSEPLDEDLFSDLTLQVPSPTLTLSPIHSPSKPSPTAGPTTLSPSPARQVSRKKKRAVRIGYARDAVSIDDEPHLPSTAFSSSAPLPPIFSEEATSLPPIPPSEPTKAPATDLNSDIAVQPRDTSQLEKEVGQQENASSMAYQEQTNKEEECIVETTSKSESNNSKMAMENEEGCDSIDQKLAVVRAKISKKAELAKQRAVSITAKRKELALKRRNVEEELTKASAKYKELEKELEEACEAEDFERAERISNSLASVENDKNQLLLDLRSAELDYESVESDMQDVLNLHLAAQEEAGSLLELFAKVPSY